MLLMFCMLKKKKIYILPIFQNINKSRKTSYYFYDYKRRRMTLSRSKKNYQHYSEE